MLNCLQTLHIESKIQATVLFILSFKLSTYRFSSKRFYWHNERENNFTTPQTRRCTMLKNIEVNKSVCLVPYNTVLSLKDE